MEINSLFEFTELAKRLSFTETARVLNMSQPTLSKHIINLERELRVPLFDRQGAKLKLTKAGNELIPFAYRTIEANNAFFEEAKRIKNSVPIQLSVSGLTNEEIIMEVLGRTISALYPEYGNSFLEVKACHSRQPLDLIKDDSVDVIFDYMDPSDIEDSSIQAHVLGRYDWFALVSSSHRLAAKSSITLNDLEQETLIKIEGTNMGEAWRFIERACLRHDFSPKFRQHYSMRLGDLLSASSMLENDVFIVGSSFMKRIEAGLTTLCKILPIADEDAFFPISAIYSLDRFNPLLDRFIELLETEYTFVEDSDFTGC